MTLREHVKERILKSTFDVAVIDVYVHMFAVIGNGYEWNKKGELVYDLRSAGYEKSIQYWQELADQYKDQPYFAAQVLKRQFIHENIDAILDANTMDDPFVTNFPKLHGAYMSTHVSFDYAEVFNFPKHINKEYAKAIWRFIDYWLQALNNTHGVGSQKPLEEAIAHWPEDAKQVRTKLHAAREKLIDTGHFGTREQRAENAKKILEMLDKVLGKTN